MLGRPVGQPTCLRSSVCRETIRVSLVAPCARKVSSLRKRKLLLKAEEGAGASLGRFFSVGGKIAGDCRLTVRPGYEAGEAGSTLNMAVRSEKQAPCILGACHGDRGVAPR
jgi:hypothetical protein